VNLIWLISTIGAGWPIENIEALDDVVYAVLFDAIYNVSTSFDQCYHLRLKFVLDGYNLAKRGGALAQGCIFDLLFQRAVYFVVTFGP
jgi:hypothetical protein